MFEKPHVPNLRSLYVVSNSTNKHMGAARDYQYVSKDEYLEAEKHAEYRSEFHDGEIFAMAGGTPEHALIASNTGRALGNALQKKDCRVYGSDLMLEVADLNSILYPDVTVICGKPEKNDPDKAPVNNPQVIVEVLSDSSEGYDRGEKFRKYRRLDSLREYVLIAQDRVGVDAFYKNEQGDWLLLPSCTALTDELRLQSLGVSIPLAEIYEKTDLE